MQIYTLKDMHNRIILKELKFADGFVQRAVGLLGKSSMSESSGLLIQTNAIHTCFMRFPLDLIFLNRQNRVLKIVYNVKPWRIAVCFGAFQVVECLGGIVPCCVQVGMQLCFVAE